MSPSHKYLAILCLTFSQLQAEEVVATTPSCESPQPAPQPPPPPPPPKPTCCGIGQKPMRITARHIEANGIGYDQGYTTLEGFFTPIELSQTPWTPFIDLRGHVFNNGKFATNVGVGVRYFCGSRIWGTNLYYDYRNTNRQHYNQAAIGFESLGRVWDFRLNGYLPVGDKTSSWKNTRFARFQGNSLYVSRKREFVFGGANAEVGVHVDNFKDVPLYFTGGSYYLHGRQKTAWGGQLRARADVYEYLTLEANVSYDSAFRWVGQGQVGLNYYFGGKRKIVQGKNCSCARAMTMSDRAVQRVDRFEIVPVDKRRKTFKADVPFSFIFVNNLSSSNGTWESPYPTLQQAEANSSPNDVIYVLPGSGDPYIVTVINGFSMQQDQKLWGAATPHVVNTQFGPVVVPPLASVMPKVENTLAGGTANVVTMAAGCEVSGMHVLGPDVLRGISAIFNGASQSVSVNNNLVEISATSVSAPVAGIHVKNTGVGSVVASIANNQCFNITNLGGSDILSGIRVQNSGSGTIIATITDNQCSNLSGGSSQAIHAANAATGSLRVSESNNQVSNVTGTTLAYNFFVENQSSGPIVASLLNNTLSNSSAPTNKGVYVLNNSTGNVCTTVIGNNTGETNEANNADGGVLTVDSSSGNNTPALTEIGTISGTCP